MPNSNFDYYTEKPYYDHTLDFDLTLS